MALNKKSMDYISVDRQINQAATDPDYVSVKDYVKTLAAGGRFAAEKITPPVLAKMIEQDCNKALRLVRNIKTADNNSLMYEVADVQAWANLGLYFAQKLKGAVALHTYREQGGEENKQNAVRHLEEALRYWDVVVGITRPIYKDMPLTHYSEQDDKLRFHWAILRPEVARDVEIARNALLVSVKEGN